MKIFHFLILGLLSILSFQSVAQISDLQRDKNITWIGAFHSDFVTEQRLENKLRTADNYVTPLKYINSSESPASEEYVLQNIVFEAIKVGKLKIYADENCTTPTTYDNICNHDIIMTLNANTYETEVKVVPNAPYLNRLKAFRTYQILYYNAQKAQFGVRTLAIALMYQMHNAQGDITWSVPLFWMKATDLSKKKRLNCASITWAERINPRNGVDLRRNSIEILKNTSDKSPVESLFESFLTNPKIDFYKNYNAEVRHKFSKAERKDFFIRRDTVVRIDAVTQEETHLPTFTELKASDITHLKFTQTWYWNSKKNRLEIWVPATAPAENLNDFMLDNTYRQPLFYRQTH